VLTKWSAYLRRPPGRRGARTVWRGTGGATATEFGLIAPVLILILYLIMETGRLIWTQSSLQLAVDEGSRFAAARSGATNAQIQDAAAARLIGVPAGAVTWTITREAGTTMNFVTVTANHTFTLVAPLLTDVDAGLLQLSARSRTPVPP